MAQHTSLRMLAISAAVAAMLAACGGGNDGGSGAAAFNGAGNGVPVAGGNNGGGNNNAAPAAIKPAVNALFTRDGNTVTVTLVDANGNPVSLPAGATIPVLINGTPTNLTVNSNGQVEYDVPPGGNGIDFEFTDPTSGNTFTSFVPGVRFKHKNDGTGTVEVQLIDANGGVIPGSSNATAAITGGSATLPNSNVDLSNVTQTNNGEISGSFIVNSPADTVSTFTLTDGNNTFTGTIDTGSFTDNDGYYVLGCNQNSPAGYTFSFVDPATQKAQDVPQGDNSTQTPVNKGQQYTYTFTVEYKDSEGTPLKVSRDVNIRIVSGEGSAEDKNGQDISMTGGKNNPGPAPVFMKDGKGESLIFTPQDNGTVVNFYHENYYDVFVLRMTDFKCNQAGKNATPKDEQKGYYDRYFKAQ